MQFILNRRAISLFDTYNLNRILSLKHIGYDYDNYRYLLRPYRSGVNRRAAYTRNYKPYVFKFKLQFFFFFIIRRVIRLFWSQFTSIYILLLSIFKDFNSILKMETIIQIMMYECRLLQSLFVILLWKIWSYNFNKYYTRRKVYLLRKP